MRCSLTDIKRLINRTVSSYKKINHQDRDGMIIDNQNSIRKEIIEARRPPFWHMESISCQYAMKGFCLIETGGVSPEALRFLNLSFMYKEVAQEIEFNENKNSVCIQLEHVRRCLFKLAPLLLWSILIGNKSLAKKIRNQFLFYLNLKNVTRNLHLDYELFCLWLYESWVEEKSDIIQNISGDFKQLIDHWYADAEKLQEIVISICDFHCEEMVDNQKKPALPRFMSPPCDLIPLEIHVINKLRQSHSLSRLIVDHPITNTNIAIVSEFSIVEDDFLEYIQINIF